MLNSSLKDRWIRVQISIRTTGVLPLSTPTLQEELDHEAQMMLDGLTRSKRTRIRNEQEGRGSSTAYGKTLTSETVDPLSKRIVSWIGEARVVAGRHANCLPFIEILPADITALITVKAVIDGITMRRAMTYVANQIGRRMEMEFRHMEFEKSKPALYKTVMERLSENPQKKSEKVRLSTVANAMKKFNVVFVPWSSNIKTQVGVKMIDLFIEATGLVQLTSVTIGPRRTQYFVEATPQLVKFIDQYTARSDVMNPMLAPTIIPPKDWTGPTGGGYHHPKLRQPLVKRMSRGLAKELESRDIRPVLRAVNSVQSTAYRIDKFVLETAELVRERGIKVKGCPPWVDIPKPPLPHGFDPAAKGDARWANVSKQEMAEWYAKAGEGFRENLAAVSKRIGVARTLYIANQYKQREAIWFPHNLDFRGRLYALPQYLNPQGSDLARGLLQFAEGKPLGDRGLWWLKVHLANCFGYDKVPMEERVAWTDKNWVRLCKIGEDPLSDLWWTDADKPYQFLQAARDAHLAEDLNIDVADGISHTPIMVDGSNNGVQHLAALSRDRAAGALVNLVPGPKPADIYATVAKRTVALLEEACRTSSSTEPESSAAPSPSSLPSSPPSPSTKSPNYASQWLSYGLSRSDVKRPTMIFPYNGTREACKKYLLDSVRERASAGQAHPFSSKLKPAVHALSGFVWKAINDTVDGPRVVMRWMCDSAKLVAKQQIPISWTVPTGFVVVQGYKDRGRRLVKARIGDSVVRVTLREECDSFDTRRQSRAIPPNYVHSMDAAALMLTVNHCVDLGITSFAAIHDSYGTHACDMDTLASGLREMFAAMYYDGQALERLRSELQAVCPKELPPVPPMGDLDIDEVRKSQFFFA